MSVLDWLTSHYSLLYNTNASFWWFLVMWIIFYLLKLWNHSSRNYGLYLLHIFTSNASFFSCQVFSYLMNVMFLLYLNFEKMEKVLTFLFIRFISQTCRKVVWSQFSSMKHGCLKLLSCFEKVFCGWGLAYWSICT